MTAIPGDLLTFARGELLGRIERAQERIWLASPFLSAPIARYVSEMAARSTATDKRLLTALVPGSVMANALDPKALEILRRAEFKISTRRNLHAKVSIVDGEWGLIGSGNLTNAGLGSTSRGNVELGVVLDEAQVERATCIFDEWWVDSEAVSQEMIQRFDALERMNRARGGQGSPVEPPQTGQLEEILAEDAMTASDRGYWLKSAYHSPDDPDWWHRGWISDSPSASRYRKEDLIVIYLGAENRGPRLCPAVVRAIAPSRHDPEWVTEHRDPRAAVKWPYVTETAFVADVPTSQGVSLGLVGKSGQSLQRGNCSISRAQFEILAEAMLKAGN